MSFNTFIGATVGGLRGARGASGADGKSALRSAQDAGVIGQTATDADFVRYLAGLKDGADLTTFPASAVTLADGRMIGDAILAQPVGALRTASLATIAANEHAASGTLAHEWISPGADYATGQWLWDSAWTAIAAVALGKAVRAQAWLLNWPSRQLASGMLPCTIYPNQASDNVAYSQVPVLARAVWTLYQRTQDAGFLAAMQPCLKAFHGWWETSRTDAGGLPSWGSSRAGASAGQVAQDARYESGQDANIGFFDDEFAAPAGSTIDHCWPDLAGWLADAADHIALIAGALGNPSDQSIYAGKADALRARMNSLMWDDEQGCYLPVVRSDLAALIGTLGAAAAAGATSVTMAAGLPRALVRGAKLVMGGVVAQVGADTPAGATAVPILIGLPAGIAGGTPVQVRTLLYCKTLSNHVAPMLAGAPSQAQVRRIVDEHVLFQLDGQTPETFTAYLGSGYNAAGSNGRYLLKYRHLAWGGPATPAGVTVDASDWSQGTNGGEVATLYGRARQDDNRKATSAYRADWESAGPMRPLTMWARLTHSATAGNPQFLLASFPSNTVVLNEVVALGGAAGDLVTVQAPTLTAGALPYYGRFFRENNGGNAGPLAVQSVGITSYPFGFVWLTPFGLIANSRLSNTSVATETDSDPADAASNPLGSDYWRGDHWVNLEHVAVLGLQRYGMQQDATEIARRVVARCAAELARTGQLWERYSMRGQGKGSTAYAWTALVVPMAQTAGLA